MNPNNNYLKYIIIHKSTSQEKLPFLNIKLIHITLNMTYPIIAEPANNSDNQHQHLISESSPHYGGKGWRVS